MINFPKVSACLVMFASALLFSLQSVSASEPPVPVQKDSRCPVCGMFVAKYSNWLTAVSHDDGTVEYFDGVKDMLAYYFDPAQFGAKASAKIDMMWAKDYYSLQWITVKQGYFVTGSDVYGPMGHELIPFSSKKAADSFLKDHKGKKVYAFEIITSELVESLRSGSRMK